MSCASHIARPHVAIVGAGLIGVSTADALLRRGARVTLIEAQGRAMRGASFANSGMIHPSQACSWAGPANDPATDDAVLELAMRSRALLASRMDELGLTAMRRRAPGCYQLFDNADQAKAAHERLSTRGIPVRTVAPGHLPIDMPALFYPEDRSGDACAYGEALMISVREGGADVLTGQAAQLSRDESGRVCVHLRTLGEGDMGRRSETVSLVGATHIHADAVVIAAGTESPRLMRAVGLDLPMISVRGWAEDYDLPDHIALPDSPIMDARTRTALTTFHDRVRLSGTWGAETQHLLRKRWSALLPELFEKAGSPRLTWSGLRPVSKNGRPFIAKTPLANLWVNAGHGHMGWTLCAGSGDLMSRMILDDVSQTAFAYSERSNVRIPNAL